MPSHRPHSCGPLRALAAVGVAALVLIGCGDDGGEAAVLCGPITVEPLDPNQGHLLAGADEPTFRTDPPTSGPHIAGLVVAGDVDRPLTGLEQVSTLETGAVIIQYRDPDHHEQLADLASDAVVVAPAPDLDAEVIATGWVRSMRCDDVDLDALRGFIEEVGGQYVAHGDTAEGG